MDEFVHISHRGLRGASQTKKWIPGILQIDFRAIHILKSLFSIKLSLTLYGKYVRIRQFQSRGTEPWTSSVKGQSYSGYGDLNCRDNL